MPPDLPPMLAGRGLPDAADLDAWAVEPKLDGWRARVVVHGTRVTVRSRTGRDITGSLPELASLGGRGLRLVLDGELIAGAGTMADFYALSGRLAQRGDRRSQPVRFQAFDLLWLDGRSLTARPYAERRARLEALDLRTGAVGTIPRYPGGDALDLLAACDTHGMEGIVLKRLASSYRPGKRSDDWRKVKCAGWADHAERRRLARR